MKWKDLIIPAIILGGIILISKPNRATVKTEVTKEPALYENQPVNINTPPRLPDYQGQTWAEWLANHPEWTGLA